DRGASLRSTLWATSRDSRSMAPICPRSTGGSPSASASSSIHRHSSMECLSLVRGSEIGRTVAYGTLVVDEFHACGGSDHLTEGTESTMAWSASTVCTNGSQPWIDMT